MKLSPKSVHPLRRSAGYSLSAMGSFTEEQEELQPDRVAELLGDDEVQLIDVREEYEHEAGRIAGDRHIVMDRLAAEADSLEGGRPIVFYCRTGSRSALATQAFRASGRQAYNLDGGIIAWVERGLPIEPEDGTIAPH
jgi:rhodanese-related sulfurtransferase